MDIGANEFVSDLFLEIRRNMNFVEQNFDYHRFPNGPTKSAAKERLKSKLSSNYKLYDLHSKAFRFILDHVQDLQALNSAYLALSDEKSKKCLVAVFAFRALGYNLYKLPTNTPEYWSSLKKAEALLESDGIKTVFQNGTLQKCKLHDVGFPITMYYNAIGILTDFILEQYAYKSEHKTIEVTNGDVVIDCGGCYGDTALYFSHKQGATGKTYVFEFIPSNLDILKTNLDANPDLKQKC